MSDFDLLIDGALVKGDLELTVVNPATGAASKTCGRASRRQLDEAIDAARRVLPSWRATAVSERQAALLAIADSIDANIEELSAILTEEQGKPLKDARLEIAGAAAMFRYFSGLDLPMKLIEDSASRRVEQHRVPIGVVGAILPWNVPFGLMAFKVPPALLAGNTLVVKPAATTPLTTLRFGALVKDLLPPGVLNIIADNNDLGPAMTAHPGIDKISFTGSTVTGKRIMAGAADSLKRLTLELGGNDPAIVLEDADAKSVARRIYRSAFMNAGQVCVAIKRLYVPAKLYDEVVAELVRIADEAVVGDGAVTGTQMGPVQNRAQFDKLRALILEAREAGTIVAGGEPEDGGGYFIRPTIVRDIDDGSRLVDEEQFGPVLPVIRYHSLDDAIVRANNSKMALGASVWGTDEALAYDVAMQLEAGTVWINKHSDIAAHIPFGGTKQSGVGVELGTAGLKEFTRAAIINIARARST
jgi:acyl-CoA reductase-like NAD-dependent aldehyde dehydrogenase